MPACLSRAHPFGDGFRLRLLRLCVFFLGCAWADAALNMSFRCLCRFDVRFGFPLLCEREMNCTFRLSMLVHVFLPCLWSPGPPPPLGSRSPTHMRSSGFGFGVFRPAVGAASQFSWGLVVRPEAGLRAFGFLGFTREFTSAQGSDKEGKDGKASNSTLVNGLRLNVYGSSRMNATTTSTSTALIPKRSLWLISS